MPRSNVAPALASLCAVALASLGVDVRLPRESPAVQVDATQIEHVLVNLLENALAVSPDFVEVRAEQRNGEVVVRIADRGPGIAANAQREIFEPFNAAARGTGLGLAIARGFLQVNGGRLWVESEEGRGASFAFALPAVRGPA